jgi:hypothetical protein
MGIALPKDMKKNTAHAYNYQRTEDRGQKTENRRQRIAVRKQKIKKEKTQNLDPFSI